MSKKLGLSMYYPLQPMKRPSVMPPQSFVFPGRPPDQNMVQALKGGV
jgi:hypothetical protein